MTAAIGLAIGKAVAIVVGTCLFAMFLNVCYQFGKWLFLL